MPTLCTKPTLRPYQAEVRDKARAAVKRNKQKIIIQAETGAGKTVIASSLIESCYHKGKSALFLARGRELVNQASRTLWDFGVPHGLIMAGEEYLPANIQVASKDSLETWLKRGTMTLPAADLVVVDECHQSMAAGWRQLINLFAAAGSIILGLSATPCRMDGRGLGDLYEELITCVPPSQLIREGWVLPTKVFAPYKPNLKGVKRSGADYSLADLGKRLNKSALVGDAVDNWRLHGEDRPTLVYCATIAHSMHVTEQFRKLGIQVAHIDGEMDNLERDERLCEFRDGRLQVLCNVGVLKEGVDLPRASCGVLLRPTLSYVFFRQMVGRLKRPAEGKTDCLLLDHAGAVFRHGLPDMDVAWKLETSGNLNKEMHKKAQRGEDKPIECKACHAVFSGSRFCPNCGAKVAAIHEPKKVKAEEGYLVEVPDGLDTEAHLEEEKARYWRTCLGTQPPTASVLDGPQGNARDPGPFTQGAGLSSVGQRLSLLFDPHDVPGLGICHTLRTVATVIVAVLFRGPDQGMTPGGPGAGVLEERVSLLQPATDRDAEGPVMAEEFAPGVGATGDQVIPDVVGRVIVGEMTGTLFPNCLDCPHGFFPGTAT